MTNRKPRKRRNRGGRGGRGSSTSILGRIRTMEELFRVILQEAEDGLSEEEISRRLYEAWGDFLRSCRPNILSWYEHQLLRKCRRMKQAIPFRESGRQTLDPSVYRTRNIVDVDSYYTFIEQLKKNPDYQEHFLRWISGSRTPEVYQYDMVNKWIKEHGAAKTDWDEKFDIYEVNFASIYADAVDEVFGTRLVDFYDLKENMNVFEAALGESPQYRGVAEVAYTRYSENRRVAAALIESIPDDYTQLFPLAREMKRHFILHVGGTNSGKTWEAMEALKKAKTGIYLAPLRLLAFEKFEELNTAGIPCSMVTGEEEISIPFSYHQSSTVDVLNYTQEYECAVIDECQMLADTERGGRWTNAILGVCAGEVHLCLAPHAEQAVIRLIEACHDTYEVRRHERKTPLIVERRTFDLNETEQGDALIVFSKRDVHAVAAELKNYDVQASVIYGALPYSVRQSEAARFREGTTRVVVATDAIGMGMNLPIRRVIFLNTEKFDGISKRKLHTEEIQQIAGRAGRYGMYEQGLVNVQGMSKKVLRKKLQENVPDIEIIRISFPESLKGIDASLSTIFARWNSLEPQPGFLYTNMEREKQLALELEKLTGDKELIYAYATMAYAEDDPELHELWLECFNAYRCGEELPVDERIRQCLAVEDQMDQLEQSFRYMDVLFQCQRLKSKESEEIAKIIRCKELISDRIINLLKEQKLTKRTCKKCGRDLPWNYRFNICQRCFDGQRGRYDDYGWY